MTKKSIAFLSIFFVLAVLVAGGILWYSQKVQNQIVLSENEIQQMKPVKPTEELAWYNIPELGIRFKVTKKIADDLVVYEGVKNIDARSETHGPYNFLDATLRSQVLIKKADCYDELGSIRKFQGTPNQYDGSMWGPVNNEVDLGVSIHQFNGYFIVGTFAYAVENPHSCFTGNVEEEYKSIFEDMSRSLTNSFRKTVEEILKSEIE